MTEKSPSELVPESRVEKALSIIAETDREVAAWKGAELRTEFFAKTAEALAFKQTEGSSAEERKQLARLTPEVQKAWEEHFVAVTKHAEVRARREREFAVIDVWRTTRADQRRGNV